MKFILIKISAYSRTFFYFLSQPFLLIKRLTFLLIEIAASTIFLGARIRNRLGVFQWSSITFISDYIHNFCRIFCFVEIWSRKIGLVFIYWPLNYSTYRPALILIRSDFLVTILEILRYILSSYFMELSLSPCKRIFTLIVAIYLLSVVPRPRKIRLFCTC